MPALLLTLLPLLVQHAPDLIGLAMGGRAADVAKRVEATVTRVFGTTDHDAIQQQITVDPAKADTLKAQLAADVEALKVQTADVANARSFQARLVELHSRLQFMPAILSAFIFLGFFTTLYGVIYFTFAHPSELTVNQVAVLNLLLGVLTAAFMMVNNYWFGTSSGSMKRGDQAIAAAYDAAPGTR